MSARICDECGSPVTVGEAFCGVCGTFLAWENGAGTSALPPATAPAVTAPPRTTPPPVPPLEAAAPAPGPPDRAGPPDPLNGHEPTTADQPSAVQPARPAARRPTVRTHADDGAGPDDLLCPVCDTGNARGRSFCRRCGASLVSTAQQAARPPWWRRWRLPRRRRRWGLLGRLLTWLLVLALLAGLGYGAVVLGRKATDAVRDRIAKPQPVHPVSVQASSSARGHPAASVADGLSNRYWAPATTGAATGEYVELTFPAPFRLLDLIVHAGAATEQEVFLTQARPAQLELTAWTQDGRQLRRTLRLADRPGEQKFHWVVGDVVRVRLTIGADYGAARGRRVALGEVEFFKRP